MTGLQRVCKIYGRIDVTDRNGNKVTWLWDYAEDKAVLKEEMTQERLKKSELAKYSAIKDKLF